MKTNRLASLLLLISLICAGLTACVVDKPKPKPVQYPYNIPWPASDVEGQEPLQREKKDWELLYQRVRSASEKRLGTRADESTIRKILATQSVNGNETRWLNAGLVMVSGESKTAGFIYVLQKQDADTWSIIAHYRTYAK